MVHKKPSGHFEKSHIKALAGSQLLSLYPLPDHDFWKYLAILFPTQTVI
jgi:hypothetical protein